MFRCPYRAAGGRGGPAGSGPDGPGSQGALGSELARTRADLAEVREVSLFPPSQMSCTFPATRDRAEQMSSQIVLIYISH